MTWWQWLLAAGVASGLVAWIAIPLRNSRELPRCPKKGLRDDDIDDPPVYGGGEFPW